MKKNRYRIHNPARPGELHYEGLDYEKLAEIFELADSQGLHEQAADILNVMLSRVDKPVTTSHNIPKPLAGIIPAFLWHQKSDSGEVG